VNKDKDCDDNAFEALVDGDIIGCEIIGGTCNGGGGTPSPGPTTLEFDLAGYVANGTYTDPTNTVVIKTIPAGSQITAISYTNLSYTSSVNTYMNNMVFSISDGQGNGDVVYWEHLPGGDADPPAPNQQGTWPTVGTQSGSWVNPGPYGGGPFTVQPSGEVRMAIYDDSSETLQTVNTGTVTVTYT
jgi:hypothetical protein